jgi:NitT/TauT family transport system substrate-binding protein
MQPVRNARTRPRNKRIHSVVRRAQDGLGVVLVVLCLCGAAQTEDRIRVGFGSLASSHMVLLAAKDFGLFRQYHVDAEIVGNIPGAKSVVPLLSGDAQVIHAAGPPFLLGALGGSDVVMFMGLINTMPFYLMAHRDIAAPAQLKGKKIGVSTLGSSSDFAARFALTKLGLDPERDVTILALGDSAIRVGALNNGTVQAGTYSLGEAMYLKQLGHRQLLDLALSGVEYQHTAVATTRSFLGHNRKTIVNYAKAIVAGMKEMKNRKEDSLKLMAKYLRIDDRHVLESQYEENVNKLYAKKPYPTLAGVQTILNGIPKIAKTAKPEEFVDMTIVRELDESGFIDRLYR